MNADQTKNPGKAVASSVIAKYQFPYPPGAKEASEVVMKLYLLDADKNPHNGSNVQVTFDSGAKANLSSPATVKVPLATDGNTFEVEWLSTGPETNYSSPFFLVLDAGGTYGQSVFGLMSGTGREFRRHCFYRARPIRSARGLFEALRAWISLRALRCSGRFRKSPPWRSRSVFSRDRILSTL